jgi:hypothetical protein
MNISYSAFWTSGSTSASCAGKYAWCGFDEIVDFDGLQSPRMTSRTGKDCLALSTQNNSRVELLMDDCKVKKRVICQVRHIFNVFGRNTDPFFTIETSTMQKRHLP